MKFAYRNREFWCKGYYVDTAGKNTKEIKKYIAEQLCFIYGGKFVIGFFKDTTSIIAWFSSYKKL